MLRARWLLTVEGSWEKVGDSSVVQCKTRFGQIFHIFFFVKHIFVDPLPNRVPRSRCVLRRGSSGYEITSLPSHSISLSIICEYLFVLSQWKLHCSCLKPLVLSNVVQGGSLSASFQDYHCFLKNPALMDKMMWSTELQLETLIIFFTFPPHPLIIERYQQRSRLYVKLKLSTVSLVTL